MDKRLARKIHWKKVFLGVMTGICILGILFFLYLYFQPEIQQVWIFIQEEDASPFVIIPAFLFLPMVGFPVTPLLIILGLRFGYLYGLIAMFSLMPAHLLVAFGVTRSLFRQQFIQLAEKNGLDITGIPENKRRMTGFVFMAVPGLSYTMKNYLLPLSGIKLKDYLLCGWLVQGSMGIPFVVVGKAARQWSIPIFIAFIGIFLVFFMLRKWIYKQYQNLV